MNKVNTSTENITRIIDDVTTHCSQPSEYGLLLPGLLVEIVELVEALAAERDRLVAENIKLKKVLQWFVDNDETNEGDTPLPEYGGKTWNEINAYWIDGLKRARALLERTSNDQPQQLARPCQARRAAASGEGWVALGWQCRARMARAVPDMAR